MSDAFFSFISWNRRSIIIVLSLLRGNFIDRRF